jgi:hypothetical protein
VKELNLYLCGTSTQWIRGELADPFSKAELVKLAEFVKGSNNRDYYINLASLCLFFFAKQVDK